MSDKVVLITGGRRGIGLACALAFVREGYKVAVVAKSHDSGELPKEIFYFSGDLTDWRRCGDWAVRKVVKKFGRIDILVNNAGMQQFSPALDYKHWRFEKDVALMQFAPLDLAAEAAKVMIKQGGGKIINIASIGGIQGTRNCIGYSMCKAALIEMTKCLSNEMAPKNIQVNAVAPGYIVTDMLKPLLDDKGHAYDIHSRIPAGQWGLPKDVAEAVLFLASDASDYITGTTLIVDGGWSAR